jgi:hypothetical protein
MGGFATEQASENEAVDRSTEERSAGNGALEEVLEENLEGKEGRRGLTDRHSAAGRP